MCKSSTQGIWVRHIRMSVHPWCAQSIPYGKRKRKRDQLACARALPKQESKTHERVASPHCDDRSSTLRYDGTGRAQNSKGDERLMRATMSWT